MTHKLVITGPAQRDMAELHAHIQAGNPVAALETVTRILDAASLLRHHPFMGRTGRVPGTRELVVTSSRYVIAYRVKEDLIEVARIMHHARAWPRRM